MCKNNPVSSGTVVRSYGFSFYLVIHAGTFLSLHGIIWSLLVTNIAFRNSTLNRYAGIFFVMIADAFQGKHNCLHLPFYTDESRRYTRSPSGICVRPQQDLQGVVFIDLYGGIQRIQSNCLAYNSSTLLVNQHA